MRKYIYLSDSRIFLSLTPRGFHMAPLYDILTAQPSLDARQIQRKQFKLSMSVGKNRHYEIHEILPRHYIQTADKAGVGQTVVASIMDDLKQTATKNADTVFNCLPAAFPPSLIDPVRKGIMERVARLDVMDVDSQ